MLCFKYLLQAMTLEGPVTKIEHEKDDLANLCLTMSMARRSSRRVVDYLLGEFY